MLAVVVKVPTDVPLDILGPLGCGIQTGAGAVLNSLDPPAGSCIAIFGAGAVGDAAILAVPGGALPVRPPDRALPVRRDREGVRRPRARRHRQTRAHVLSHGVEPGQANPAKSVQRRHRRSCGASRDDQLQRSPLRSVRRPEIAATPTARPSRQLRFGGWPGVGGGGWCGGCLSPAGYLGSGPCR